MSRTESPLIKPVVKRDTNKSYNFNPADFTEDVEYTEVEQEAPEIADAPKGGQKSPPMDLGQFADEPEEGSPETPYFTESLEGEFDHETDEAKEKAVEEDRKMLIATVLEGIDWVVPAGASYITKIDTGKLKEWRAKNKFFAVDIEDLEAKNDKNAKTFEFFTHEYTKRIENPLRRVAKDRAIDVSPEAQIMLYTVGFFIILGYYCYSINAENKKMMEKFEKAHEVAMRRMEKVMDAEKANTPKTPAEDVTAEEVTD